LDRERREKAEALFNKRLEEKKKAHVAALRKEIADKENRVLEQENRKQRVLEIIKKKEELRKAEKLEKLEDLKREKKRKSTNDNRKSVGSGISSEKLAIFAAQRASQGRNVLAFSHFTDSLTSKKRSS
jgi:hypothetical protein